MKSAKESDKLELVLVIIIALLIIALTASTHKLNDNKVLSEYYRNEAIHYQNRYLNTSYELTECHWAVEDILFPNETNTVTRVHIKWYVDEEGYK